MPSPGNKNASSTASSHLFGASGYKIDTTTRSYSAMGIRKAHRKCLSSFSGCAPMAAVVTPTTQSVLGASSQSDAGEVEVCTMPFEQYERFKAASCTQSPPFAM